MTKTKILCILWQFPVGTLFFQKIFFKYLLIDSNWFSRLNEIVIYFFQNIKKDAKVPRTKKTNESNVSLLSNIVPPDAPVNLDALGDLAKPITFPENKDSAENNTQVQTKRRGRKPKNATEPSAQEEAPKNAPKEKDFKPANEQSSEPHYQPPINIFDYAEKNSFDQSYEDNRSEAPIVDGIEAAERRQAKELGLEQSQQEAPQSVDSQANNTDAQGNGAPAERDQANGDAQQNANQQNNQQRQQFNK